MSRPRANCKSQHNMNFANKPPFRRPQKKVASAWWMSQARKQWDTEPKPELTMNRESLFDLNETLSPRLAWMRQRNVELKENVPNPEPGAESDLGHELHRWYAGAGGVWIGGATQDEAIVNLCKYKGWRLWNEPAAPDSK